MCNTTYNRYAMQILTTNTSEWQTSIVYLKGQNIPYTKVNGSTISVTDWAEANCVVKQVIGLR